MPSATSSAIEPVGMTSDRDGRMSLAETHDRALAELLVDLCQGDVERLLPVESCCHRTNPSSLRCNAVCGLTVPTLRRATDTFGELRRLWTAEPAVDEMLAEHLFETRQVAATRRGESDAARAHLRTTADRHRASPKPNHSAKVLADVELGADRTPNRLGLDAGGQCLVNSGAEGSQPVISGEAARIRRTEVGIHPSPELRQPHPSTLGTAGARGDTRWCD